MSMSDEAKKRVSQNRLKKRGTLLKDVPVELIHGAGDLAEETGLDTVKPGSHNRDMAYLRRATEEQLEAFKANLLWFDGLVMFWNNFKNQMDFRHVPVFDLKALVTMMKVLVSDPEKYVARFHGPKP